jgi:acyl-CoA synthetase (AMP-forming)/AMP-acid ligase II
MPFPDLHPTIPELARTTAERFGDAPYVVTGSERLSYADADRRSRAVAAGLLASGVGKGAHVGILMPNSADWVVAFYAITRIGAAAVPINTFVQPRELAWTLHHADVAVLLAHPRLLTNDYPERLEAALPGLAEVDADGPLMLNDAPYLRRIFVWGECDRRWSSGDEQALTELGASVPEGLLDSVEACVTPADPAVIVYTSGSTADPKGIVHSHGTDVRHSYNLTFPYITRADDVLFTSMPFFWIGGLMTGLLAVVHHGAVVVTQPSFDATEALELMERHRATITQGWPQQGKTLAADPTFATRDLSSIRRTSMPDSVPPEHRAPEISTVALGMTETCSCHTNYDPYVALAESKRGTFGPSVEGLEHKIIDPESGHEVPRGVEGEILVRGYSLMLGRYKVERADVFDADGWLHTGDAGRMDEDGWIFFTGRLGDMIKTAGGTNVTPAEVEAALASVPGVQEAYVTGVPDPEGTAGTQIVAAALVPRAGEAVDPEAARAALKGNLSAFKIPKHIWVCQKSELPFTDTGKLKKADLAKLLAAQLG